MTVTRLMVSGKEVLLDVGEPTDHIASCILEASTFYEGKLLRDIRRRARPGTVVDVGAHIGNHTLYFAVVCGWSVIALEPWPPSFRRLKQNVAANGAEGHVRLIQAAAGSRSGRAGIVPPPETNTGLARLTEGDDIAVVRLDDLPLPGDVSAIKIDTEGRSADVIAGAQELIHECRPLVYAEADTLEERDAVEELLFPGGYARFRRFGSTPMWGYETR